MLCTTVIDWQQEHPATKYGMEQSNFGLIAFTNFIEDIRHPGIRSQVDEACINCHVIQIQSGGRYWLGQYLTELAQFFSTEVENQIHRIGDLYIKGHSELKKFIDLNIRDGKTESEILDSVEWPENAYQMDEMILDKFIGLGKVLQL